MHELQPTSLLFWRFCNECASFTDLWEEVTRSFRGILTILGVGKIEFAMAPIPESAIALCAVRLAWEARYVDVACIWLHHWAQRLVPLTHGSSSRLQGLCDFDECVEMVVRWAHLLQPSLGSWLGINGLVVLVADAQGLWEAYANSALSEHSVIGTQPNLWFYSCSSFFTGL